MPIQIQIPVPKISIKGVFRAFLAVVLTVAAGWTSGTVFNLTTQYKEPSRPIAPFSPKPPLPSEIHIAPEPVAPIIAKDPTFISKLSKAVNALYSDRGNGIRFTCTTTNIEKTKTGYLALTAQHCIKGTDKFFILVDDKADAPFLRAQVVFDDKDYAILSYNTKQDLPVIPFGSEKLLALGAPVIVVSEPLDLGKILYHGYYSQEKVSDQFHFAYIGFELMAAPGSSGSAVIDPAQGAIVGVLDAVAPSPFGGVVVTLATPASTVRQGLADYKAGRRRQPELHIGVFDNWFGPAPRPN